MIPQFLAIVPRRTAEQIVASVPLGRGVEERIILAIEVAMNEEWWRGYYAGRGVIESSPLTSFSPDGRLPTTPEQEG